MQCKGWGREKCDADEQEGCDLRMPNPFKMTKKRYYTLYNLLVSWCFGFFLQAILVIYVFYAQRIKVEVLDIFGRKSLLLLFRRLCVSWMHLIFFSVLRERDCPPNTQWLKHRIWVRNAEKNSMKMTKMRNDYNFSEIDLKRSNSASDFRLSIELNYWKIINYLFGSVCVLVILHFGLSFLLPHLSTLKRLSAAGSLAFWVLCVGWMDGWIDDEVRPWSLVKQPASPTTCRPK
jgi:hypothetical protein